MLKQNITDISNYVHIGHKRYRQQPYRPRCPVNSSHGQLGTRQRFTRHSHLVTVTWARHSQLGTRSTRHDYLVTVKSSHVHLDKCWRRPAIWCSDATELQTLLLLLVLLFISLFSYSYFRSFLLAALLRLIMIISDWHCSYVTHLTYDTFTFT